MMLRAAQAPSLPSGLLDRLSELPMSAPLPPRRGLPTVLGADGIAMFAAHDARNSDRAGQLDFGQPSEEPAPPPQKGRPAPRRGAVPVTVLASAAAVVAAGTFGGHVSTLAADSNLQAPAGAANAAGALTDGRSASSLTGAGLLGLAGFSTSPATAERAAAPRSGTLATSVSVPPVLRTAGRSTSPTAGRLPSGSATVGFWGPARSAAAEATPSKPAPGARLLGGSASIPAPPAHGSITATP